MTQYTGILIGLILDALIGWGAGKITDHTGGGIIRNIIVGILGGTLGNWLFGLFGIAAGSLGQQVIVSLVGACVLLVLYYAIFGKKKRR